MKTSQEYNIEIHANDSEEVLEFSASLTDEEVETFSALIEQNNGLLYRGAYHNLIITLNLSVAYSLLNDWGMKPAACDGNSFCPDCDSFAPDAKPCAAA